MRTKLALILAVLALALCGAQAAPDALRDSFKSPPASARPWVYWFWLNGNITRVGITADLEAMKRAGVGGVLIMEVDQGAPVGDVPFASDKWREMFKWVCLEAERLGIEVNMNNDAGWNGSGGPWITPELAMQKLVWSEADVKGPGDMLVTLPQPATVSGYYRDVRVLAFPTPSAYRLPDIRGKSALVRQDVGPVGAYPATPEGAAVPRGRVLDISRTMQPDGTIAWEAPAGAWTIVRMGHTCTGAVNAPAPASGTGLECDKLSKEGSEAAFAGLMGKLIADVGPRAGKTLVRTHIDSWENGSQNWTARFPEEFRRLRGYDLQPYLPVITGRVVESVEVSERFLYDFRQTIADLLHENYAGHFQTMARRHGLELSIEAYGDTTCDNMTYAGRCDEPMAEFWSWSEYGAAGTLPEMTSAAHIYGKPIIGAEAFTAADGEKWLGHPGSIKALGDWAFTQGINRFVVHRYALQPWPDRRPGMSMGPWGLHYERGQTWWEQSLDWHRYVARCQHLLRQGHFVADVLYLQPEGAPRSFSAPPPVPGGAAARPGYNYDGCTPEALMTRVKVRNGLLTLPDGMSYRALVLPDAQRMTPALLHRVGELALAGATVIGPKPVASPSLDGYPDCDTDVQQVANALWATGKIITGKSVDKVLAARGLPPDFAADRVLNWIHRRVGGVELYFVANPRKQPANAYASFRVTGKTPEIWDAVTGATRPVTVFEDTGKVTRMALRLPPAGSAFIVFQPGRPAAAALAKFGPKGRLIGPTATRVGDIVIRKALWGATSRSVDVTSIVQGWVDMGRRAFSVEGFNVGDPANLVVKTLRVEYEIDGKQRTASATDHQPIRVGDPADDAKPVKVVRAIWGPAGEVDRMKEVTANVQQLVRERNGAFVVADLVRWGDPVPNVVKTLRVEYEVRGKRFSTSGTDGDVVTFEVPEEVRNAGAVVRTASGALAVETAGSGEYEARDRRGRTLWAKVAAAGPAMEVKGPWRVAFDPKWGGPASALLPGLASWSDAKVPGIRYYSGTARYEKEITVPAAMLGSGRRVYLDLGRVEVMAGVTLNGKELGVLWHAPYRLDVTSAVRPGANRLELKVTNLWINRQIGDEELPEDSPRNGGTMATWPDWLQADRPSPTGRYTFTSWRLWPAKAPLQPSGLLGPVRLETTQQALLKPAGGRRL